MLHKSNGNRSTNTKFRQRLGFSYIAVLGTSLIVGTVALGGLSVLRIQSRASQDAINSIRARQDGRTAAELGRYMLSNDPNWRSTYNSGNIFTNQSTGSGTISGVISDPLDGNLGNQPHHPLRLEMTSRFGRAVQRFQVDLEAKPVALDVLQHAVHSWVNLKVFANGNLTTYGAPIGINGSLDNDNVINGDVNATAIAKQGTVNGTVTNNAPILNLPSENIVTKYTGIGTEFTNRVNLIEKAVITPTRNSFAPLNSGGVYIVRPTSNMTIRNTRIHGTLVVVMPNNTDRLTIGENVLFQPAVAGYPALIVQGNLDLEYRSDGAVLSELLTLTNFNPTGAPFGGSTDSDFADVYPSEIQGLIYVTRKLRWYNDGLLRGGVLVEGQGNTNGIDIHGSPRILYDPYLFHNPGPWLTKQLDMVPRLGTWRQIVQ